MLIGYVRVSATEQTSTLQEEALQAVGCIRIFIDYDTNSSAKTERPALQEALNYLHEGDTLVVWRLDRVGRSLGHLVEMIASFQARGLDFKSLTEKIDTSAPGGRLIFHIMDALVEFEHQLRPEQTRIGIQRARVQGRKGGRPTILHKLAPEQVELALQLYYGKQTPVEEICRLLGIARTTFYKKIINKTVSTDYLQSQPDHSS